MKIKIDKSGYLWLERAGKMKQVWCPEDHYVEGWPSQWPCGDWCALFNDSPFCDDPVEHSVKLCKTNYLIAEEDFTDERGKG